jgi:inositol-hexakisphosphate kinase
MSNPSRIPENAAAADAEAVSPTRAADAGDAVFSPPKSQTQTPPPPCPPATAAQEEGSVSSVPPPPLPQSPPAAQQGTPGSIPLTAQATGISAAAHADPVKYARGPAALQRPHGPSLLTQALATARGIPRHNHSDPTHSHHHKTHPSQPTQPSSEPPAESHNNNNNNNNKDFENRDSHHHHGSRSQGDGDSLTAPVSPRKTAMASSTTTSTTVAAPVYGRLDLGEVNSMLSGHREFLNKAKGRTTGPPETPEKERPGRWNTSSLASPHLTDSPAAPHDGTGDENGLTDGRPQPRTWKTDHRVSMGPEKAWSIGNSGDSRDGQDGLVEKSISEVLAGVEHNNRSRKASHSLRFFKEGLPEEKGKRKEQRPPQPSREKSPSGGERLADIKEQLGGETAEAQAVGDVAFTIERQDRPRSLPTRTPEVKTVQGSPEDYFAVKPVEHVDIEPEVPESKSGEEESQEPDSIDSGHQPKPRRVSDLSIGTGESTEEGEDSGEEKISSAVFLPHQAPEESPEHSPMPGIPQRIVPSRRQSRHGDFHPWLVKADEPEADREQESLDFENKVGLEATEYPSVAPEVASRQVEESAPVAQREPAIVSSRLSRPVSQYREDTIHEHQLSPEQPLDAIELIPYKHQVGGHTTLWRFSRRAVCKQLNNRENEFYEKIEKYHRDLLAFLPR